MRTTMPVGRDRRVSGRSRRGAAMMEFALTLPIMVIMLLTTIEFGNYFSQLAMVKAAARDAARFGSNQATMVLAQTQGAAAARTVLGDLGFPCATGNACTVDASIVQEGGLNFVRVSVTVPYDQVTGAIPNNYGAEGEDTVVKPTMLRAQGMFPIVGP